GLSCVDLAQLGRVRVCRTRGGATAASVRFRTRGGSGRSGARGSAHDDSLLVLLGRGRLTLVRAGGRGTFGGLVDGHIAVDLLRLASRLGVTSDTDDGIALAQVDQLDA